MNNFYVYKCFLSIIQTSTDLASLELATSSEDVLIGNII